MLRLLDKRATEWARARHEAGRDLLNLFFGWDEASAVEAALLARSSFPRAERARRRRRAKVQRVARRRNR